VWMEDDGGTTTENKEKVKGVLFVLVKTGFI
jgi:hypothetical protein